MNGEVLLHGEMTLAPLAGWGVRAQDQHANGGDGDADEGNDEGNAPGDVWSEALICDEAVENGGHEKVCDASSCIAETASQGIGGTNDVLVEEASGPDLTWDEAATQNADEESKSEKARRAVDGPGQGCGYRACEETTGKGPSRSKSITGRSSNKSNE